MITPLVAYADLHDDALVGALLDLATQPDDELLAAETARAALALEVSFAEALARAVLESEGPFAVAARRGLTATDPRVGIARSELERLGVLAHGDAARILARHGLDGALSAQRDDKPERSADAQAGRGRHSVGCTPGRLGQVSVRGPWSCRTGAVGGADRGMGYGLRRDLTRVCGARAALATETGKTKNCRDHGVRIVEGGS